MPVMHAEVSTVDASRLINRLCKHFRHKIDARWDETEGFLTFAMGSCKLTARDSTLEMSCQAGSEAERDQVGDIVATHLVRFAGGEVEQVTWQSE
ncbi:DUF2218 domain-containing protein [Marinobacter fuscus]|uniref:DUF2218 domain-containing protein n=1 Tax=Marinobacter fuscus TaxID=2109942 RepID=A0A2T1K565_9GAMM|nr:DUF2218 domain-containing protein [Marinobacter fuscus]PSF05227.1 DUF2218 domain-containing protein [Marinobacter fuscus]